MPACPSPPGNGPARELILGGQKSGKSRAAEARACHWLATADHRAVLVATARAADAEMTERIARHRRERVARVPGLRTVEVFDDLAGALAGHSGSGTLVVVDCLTLWLTQLLLPPQGPALQPQAVHAAIESLLSAAAAAPGPWVFVSNEIGLGVSPMSPEARSFVDALGCLHQSIAALSTRVTLMVAGCELPVRSAAR